MKKVNVEKINLKNVIEKHFPSGKYSNPYDMINVLISSNGKYLISLMKEFGQKPIGKNLNYFVLKQNNLYHFKIISIQNISGGLIDISVFE